MFIGDLLPFHFVLLTRWVPSPCRRLSRPRTTTDPPPHPRAISRQRACPPPHWLCDGEGDPEVVPTFTMYRSTGLASSSSPAASPRVRRRLSSWPPHRLQYTDFGVASRSERACAADRPTSTRLEPAYPLRGFNHWFTFVTPFRLAYRTRAVWQCWPVPPLSGLLPPSPALPGSGCPQLHRAAATDRQRSPFISTRFEHGATWRTTSPG